MLIELPIPKNLLEWTWLAIGIVFGRAFGKQLDHEIQESDWFKGLPLFYQKILRFILDFLHHFWVGLLLMCYSQCFSPYQIEVYWFGYGLFLDDLPDVPARIRRFIKYLFTVELFA